jgi:hypothetical protein
MTDNDPSCEGGVPIHPRVSVYETHLVRLERELPSFRRQLRRIEAKRPGKALADCVLS